MSVFSKKVDNLGDAGEVLELLDELSETTDTKQFLLTIDEQLEYIDKASDELIVDKDRLEETKKNIIGLFKNLKEELKDDENQKAIKKSIEKIYKSIKKNIKDFEAKSKDFKEKNDIDYIADIDWLKEFQDALGGPAINGALKMVDDTIYKNVLTSLSNLDIQSLHIKQLKKRLSDLSNLEKLENYLELENMEASPSTFKIDDLENKIRILKRSFVASYKKELYKILEYLKAKLDRQDLDEEEEDLINNLIEDNKKNQQKILDKSEASDEDLFNYIKLTTKLDSKRIMFDLQRVESTKKVLSPLFSLSSAKKIFVEQDPSPILELLSSLSIDLVLQKKYKMDSSITFLLDNVFIKNPDIKRRITNLYKELKSSKGNISEDFATLLLIDDLTVSKTKKNMDLENGNALKDFVFKIKDSITKLINGEVLLNKDSALDKIGQQETDKLEEKAAEGLKIIKEFKKAIKINSDFKSAVERNEYIEQMTIMLKKYGFKNDIKEYFNEIRKQARIKTPIYKDILKSTEELNRVSLAISKETEDYKSGKKLIFNSKEKFKEYLKVNKIGFEIKNTRQNEKQASTQSIVIKEMEYEVKSFKTFKDFESEQLNINSYHTNGDKKSDDGLISEKKKIKKINQRKFLKLPDVQKIIQEEENRISSNINTDNSSYPSDEYFEMVRKRYEQKYNKIKIQSEYDIQESNNLVDKMFKKDDEKIVIFLDDNSKLESFISENQIISYIHDLKNKIDDLKDEVIKEITSSETYINVNKTDLIREIDKDLDSIINGEGIKDLKIIEQINKFHKEFKDNSKLENYIASSKDFKLEDYNTKRETSENNTVSRFHGEKIFSKIREKILFGKDTDISKIRRTYKDTEYEKTKVVKQNKEIAITKSMKTKKSTREKGLLSKYTNWFNSLRKDSYKRYFNDNGEITKPKDITIKHIEQAREDFSNVLEYFYKSELSFDKIEAGKQIDYNKWREILENTFSMLEVTNDKGEKELKEKMMASYHKNNFLSKIIDEALTTRDFNGTMVNIGEKTTFNTFHNAINNMEESLSKNVFNKDEFDAKKANHIVAKYFTTTIKMIGAKAHIQNIKTNQELNPDRKLGIEYNVEAFIEAEFKKRKQEPIEKYNSIYINQIIENIKTLKLNLENKLTVLIDEIDYIYHVSSKAKGLDKEKIMKYSDRINKRLKEFKYVKNIMSDLKSFTKTLTNNYQNNETKKLEFKEVYGYLNRDVNTFEENYSKPIKNDIFISKEDLNPSGVVIDKNQQEKENIRIWTQKRNQDLLQQIVSSSNIYNGFSDINETFTDFSNIEEAYKFTKNKGINTVIGNIYKQKLRRRNPNRMNLILSEIFEMLETTAGSKDQITLNIFYQEKILTSLFLKNLNNGELNKLFNKTIIEELENYNINIEEDVRDSELKKYIKRAKQTGKNIMSLLENYDKKIKNQHK